MRTLAARTAPLAAALAFASAFSPGVALVALAAASLAGCADAAPPPRVAKRELSPAWQDVFDGTPELYAVIRPRAFKRDAVYGPFFQALTRLAEARSEMSGVTALEAAKGCDEILVGVSRKDGVVDDAAIVLRGVPGGLDPQSMNDAAGHPMFRLVDDRARVQELERLDRTSASASGSLFVLPDRTWVVALGSARARARQAFATPLGRPAPKSDPDALLSVRLDPDAFLRTTRANGGSVIAPLLKGLVALTVSLSPGKGGVVVNLQYEDEDATAWAELAAKRLLEELARADARGQAERSAAAGARPSTSAPSTEGGRKLAWLEDAKVARAASALTVQLPVPPRLLEALPLASGRDLSF